jgi:hypothetical protein
MYTLINIRSSLAIIMAAMAIGVNSESPSLHYRSEGFARLSRNDPHIGDIRLFGQPGCSAENQGVWTITQSQLDTCFNFPSVVKAVNLTDINAGCNC